MARVMPRMAITSHRVDWTIIVSWEQPHPERVMRSLLAPAILAERRS